MALYMLSGKGGSGKTHLSTALSYELSQKGRKVLQVEFSHLSLYSEFFSRPVGFSPVDLGQGLFVASWTGLDCLSEYVASIAHSQRAADVFLKFPILKKLIESAPGLREVAVLGKLTSDYRGAIKLKTGFDDIVFDAPSTGHFMSLLKVPFGLRDTVGKGPMKRQCESIIETLNESQDVKFIIVKDSSEFSMTESEELTDFIKELFPQRQAITQALNFSKSSSSSKDDLSFKQLKNEHGWFMGAKDLSRNWETFIDE